MKSRKKKTALIAVSCDGVTVVRLALLSIDRDAAWAFSRALDALRSTTTGHIIVDLSGTRFTCAALVSRLEAIERLLRSSRRRLGVCLPAGHAVASTFRTSGTALETDRNINLLRRRLTR
jgi:hypothetical protein